MLPSCCHAEDTSVMTPSWKKHIIHKWPELIFDPGQVDCSGVSVVNSSSEKGAGLQETTEMVKTDDQEVATTTLTNY